MSSTKLEVIHFSDGHGPEDCLVWDEADPNPALGFMMAQMGPPDFPTPIGVIRKVDRPSYDYGLVHQIEHEIEAKGAGTLEDLIYSGELWSVDEGGQVTRGGA